ncbi:MAG TPA: ATP-binding protein [Opitutus sp.]|nr:ATP-binding protein [Opitutus sp.]
MMRNLPIRQKLAIVILTTSSAALLITCLSFFAYEFVTFRRTAVRNLATLGEIIASNSTAALAFDNPDDARETLSALRAERHIVAAALYDASGAIFAKYPAGLADSAVPAAPGKTGHRITLRSLTSFQPVVHNDRQLGILYLESDMDAMVERFQLYALIAMIVMGGSLLGAFVLSQKLQHQISRPVLALADTARAVSDRRDFSVRAVRQGDDELGVLTDAFNDMLTQIHEQDRALRESEARLRAVLNSAVSAVVVTDHLGRIIDWNACAERMFGRTRGEALGLDLGEVLEPVADGAVAGMKRFMTKADSEITTWPIEMNGHRRDGEIFPIEVAINPVVSGGVVTFCAFASDITERKKSEIEIQTLNQQLERRVAERTEQLQSANKELEAFSYSVSHDLRAPLRHIDGFANMLTTHVGDALDEKSRRYLTVIMDSAKRMGRLIDDLLSFSRHGRAELRHVPVKLGELVSEVRRQMLDDVGGRNITWKIEELPEVEGDIAMLHQVFANLLGNAVKYTRQRSEAVIEVGSRTNEEGELVVFVRDNGAGFNPKYVDRLFGVFQRLHSESEFEGTGVGLANVQRIIHRHGGRVWAEGQVNEGATFYFTLPRARRLDGGAVV